MLFESPNPKIPNHPLDLRTKRLEKAIATYMNWTQTHERGHDVGKMKQDIVDAANSAKLTCMIIAGYVKIGTKTRYREFTSENPLGLDTTRFRKAPKPRGKKS